MIFDKYIRLEVAPLMPREVNDFDCAVHLVADAKEVKSPKGMRLLFLVHVAEGLCIDLRGFNRIFHLKPKGGSQSSGLAVHRKSVGMANPFLSLSCSLAVIARANTAFSSSDFAWLTGIK